MSENVQPQNNSEEVDLGQLFKLIGNAFNRFFKFIATIFKGLFHFLILFLLFIQKHFLKFAIAGAIGLGLGIYLDYRQGDLFESSMVIEPNFNSAQQLYNNINFYNDLAEAKDSASYLTLSKALNISFQDASDIKKVRIESYSDENQKLKLFDDFVRELDTNTIKAIDYKAYLKNFNSIDARFHKITVISCNNAVAKKIQNRIVSSISENAYFKFQKEINDTNINLQDSILQKQLTEIDSLQRFYRDIEYKVAENPNQGTNINLADSNNNTNRELELLSERDRVKQNIVQLNQERANKSQILNVISDFPAKGVMIRGFWKDIRVLTFLSSLGLIFLFLSLLELNKFLKSYKENKVL